MNRKLSPGKIDPSTLQEFFSTLPRDNSVIVGPGIGKDAAVIDTDSRLVVVKTDPITFTAHNLGWYVVHVNANDIACLGGVPRWFLVTLLLPLQEKEKFLHHFFQQLSQCCKELGILLVGGHTEVTSAVTKPIAIGQMIGSLQAGKVLDNANAKPADLILLTKGLAIEGTHLLYQEKREELKKDISPQLLKRMKGFLKTPGISILREAHIATTNIDVHCMHDPTEGGLIAGVWEVATASGVGVRIKEENIPIFEETKLICQRYNLDPLSLLASGALLIVAPPNEGTKLLALYNSAKIPCTIIGEVVPPEEGMCIIKRKGAVSIVAPPKDELTKL